MVQILKIYLKKVKTEYQIRKNREQNVEVTLKSLGCIGIDGDCSNMFRCKDYVLLEKFFNYLSTAIELKSLPTFKIFDLNKLDGKRFEINNNKFELIKDELLKLKVFSFAFVTMRVLSLTYIEEEEG